VIGADVRLATLPICLRSRRWWKAPIAAIGAGGWTHEADLLEGERISAEELAAQLANPAMRVLVLPRTMALVATVSITDRAMAWPIWACWPSIPRFRQAALAAC
jgi:hypothetical protein